MSLSSCCGQAKDSANKQKHYRRAHTDDLAEPASCLLVGEIVYLRPSGSKAPRPHRHSRGDDGASADANRDAATVAGRYRLQHFFQYLVGEVVISASPRSALPLRWGRREARIHRPVMSATSTGLKRVVGRG
jgi:hypothetical protein